MCQNGSQDTSPFAGEDITAASVKIGDELLVAAQNDECLIRALFLCGSLPPDWRSVYMVLEAADDAFGGKKQLIVKKFVPDGQIKNFKATANSYNPSNRMTLRVTKSRGEPVVVWPPI